MTRAGFARALGSRGGWLLAMLLAGVALLGQWAPLQRLDLFAYDALEPLFRPTGKPPDSVIVAIDDASLAAIGRWPWSRGVHARFVDRLAEADAAAVAIAVLFAEPGPGDEQFAAAIARSGRVVLAVAPRSAGRGRPGVVETRPTPLLGTPAAALGHVDVAIDADGLARRTFRHAGSGSPQWPALALATRQLAERHGGDAGIRPVGGGQRKTSTVWVRDGEMLLPYPDARTAPVVMSAVTLLDQPARSAALREKAVFIGTTASGLDGGLTTPASHRIGRMPAVEFHARAYEALRSGQVYRTAATALTLAVALLFLAVPAVVGTPLRLGRAIGVGSAILLPALASGAVLALAQLWISPVAATIGFAIGYLVSFAVELRRTRRGLRRAQRDADATLRSIADAVVTVDAASRIVLMNPVAERLTGIALTDAQQRPLGPLLGAFTGQGAHIEETLRACLQKREMIHLPDPIEWCAPGGGACALRLTVSPLGKRDGAVLAFNDITETLAATSRLEHEATHDPLTGLPNRALLLDRLHHALALAERRRTTMALLFVDLDRFKRINDTLGHHAGDRVLQVVAARLTAAVRSGDTVARWGGDEFVVLMENLDDHLDAGLVARKMLDLLGCDVEAEPGTSLVLSCSVGIGIGPRDSTDAGTLLLMADRAMYRAKLEGGTGYTFYSPEMNTSSRDRLKMESALRVALQNREFELHYQPQVDVCSGDLVGLEALIRWRRADGELIRPDAFIPAAEESGLIRSIGEWVIREAVAQAARWKADGLAAVPIAVNVSAQQCSDMSIVDTIQGALADNGVEPGMLKIELTESTAMRDAERVAQLLYSVDRLGVGVTVDDFGTGYSSLSLLRRFPISELKIDKSFVHDIANDGDDAAIVRGTIALAHGLGMTVVAEGVETQSQLHFLARYGCNVAQGLLSSPPLPADEVRRWLTATARPGMRRAAL
ncbi:EAL domain-containing protein [Aromatoleum sp.]|uniref:EAL domain-containing protein n=1 Tax=Aromatoleum sp. TaxID=2307007 RepID=UPI002FC5E14A